jgi:glucose/arabinose dehydrogenase
MKRSLLAATVLILVALGALLVEDSTDEAAATNVPSPVVAFERGRLNPPISNPTSLAFGPDGRLYVSTLSDIFALSFDPATKQMTGFEQVAEGLDSVLAVAFDPTAPASPVVLYASHQDFGATAPYQGVVSTFTEGVSSWTQDDIITNLPGDAPTYNHMTEGLAFDSAGNLLIANGSSTDAGLTGSGGSWPETPLSAAILIADVNDPGFDGTVTYSPAGPPANHNVDQTGGDVSVFASGTRNPYDLVVHSNGSIYSTDNGPGGPNYSATCSTSGSPTDSSDKLNRIVQGNYYGHPNRNRGRFDTRQCTYFRADAPSGSGYTAPIAELQNSCSCNGIAEYTSDAFGGVLDGDLLIAQWNVGNLQRIELSPDGTSVTGTSNLATAFGQPLDVTVSSDGTVYIAEFTSGRVAYLGPDHDRDSCSDAREGGSNEMQGGARNAKSFWDFFDTPAPPNTRDHEVSAPDIFRVINRFGTSGNPMIDPLSMPPGSGYHPAFDRGPAAGDPWDLTAANGSVASTDIFASVTQFGHSCVTD